MWEHTPAVAIFEVRRGQSVRCLRAGSFHRLALGYDMTGHGLLALTSAPDREDRLAWCWNIIKGAVTVSYRAYKSHEGPEGMAQCTSMPFRNHIEDGLGHILMHSNWRPVNSDWIKGNVSGDVQVPFDRRMAHYAQPVQVAVKAA